jgi:hypothetical protein
MTRFERTCSLSALLCLTSCLGAGERLTIDPDHRLLTEKKHAVSHGPVVGDEVPGLAFRDVAGKAVYLDDLRKKGPAVFVFLSTECPLARFKRPLLLPEGTRVKVVAHHDNSAGNPNSPHSPPKPVGWGKRTVDEMCISRLSVVDAGKYVPPGKR